MTATTEPGTRFIALDLTRGIAVMGIFLMNIVGFAMPAEAYLTPIPYGGSTPLDMAVWATNFVIADGKMRGLFSVLFGASMLLVIERAEAKGDSPALTHYSRMTWLLFFGAIHAWGIWYGDILMLYAVVGCIAFFFRSMEAHRLLVLGLVLIFAQAMFYGMGAYAMWTLYNAATAPGADAELVRQWTEAQAAFAVLSPDEVARTLAIYQGSYTDILRDRLGPHFWDPIANNGYASVETLGLMLCGMAGLKSGFLTGQWERPAYMRMVRLGFVIGIPALAALALLTMASGFSVTAIFAFGFALQALVNPLMILGYAALIILWLKSSGDGNWLIDRTAAAGRAAFSNYIGTSLVCTTIFYGYGFGYYGEWSRATIYLIVPLIWLLMLLWSKPWLDRFRYGPFEWLWRTLARREIQPMQKIAGPS